MKMDWKNWFTPKRIVFLAIFFVLVFMANRINFSSLIGAENQFFTLYQFFGPTAGAFLGPIFGMISVALAQITDFMVMGKEWSLISVLRFLPMLLAVWYFGSKKKYVGVIVPIICMILFIAHPIGREVWFFSLYWLIPVLAVLLPEKVPGKLLFRSFGATFTAHAVGGAIWIYTVPMSAGQWVSLIPVVAYERILFGLGIAGSYIVFNTVLDYVVEKWKLNLPAKTLFLEKRYTLANLLNWKRNSA
ncbi:MAG TPA: hypothetical protein VJA23_06555 [Candidatus Nanoarchaeia archaeon]|nr:hypothetical protein [Candidatus Nanoarchaeia archaeon]